MYVVKDADVNTNKLVSQVKVYEVAIPHGALQVTGYGPVRFTIA